MHVGIDYDVRIVGFLRVTACVCVIVLLFVSMCLLVVINSCPIAIEFRMFMIPATTYMAASEVASGISDAVH